MHIQVFHQTVLCEHYHALHTLLAVVIHRYYPETPKPVICLSVHSAPNITVLGK